MQYLTDEIKDKVLARLEDRLYDAEQAGDFAERNELEVEINTLIRDWDIVVGYNPASGELL